MTNSSNHMPHPENTRSPLDSEGNSSFHKLQVTVRAAALSLLLLVSIPDAKAGEIDFNSINLPVGGAEVTLSSGEKVILQKLNGEFTIKPNSSSLNGTDHFEGTFITKGVVFRVISNSVERGGVSVEEYKSKIGVDYLELTSGDKQLANILLKGEIEFFNNIDKVVEFKGGGKRYKTKRRQIRRWKQEVINICKRDTNKGTFDILKVGAPGILLSFSELSTDKYATLKNMGNLFISFKNLEMSRKLRGN